MARTKGAARGAGSKTPRSAPIAMKVARKAYKAPRAPQSKKPHCWRQGVVALREIRRLQKATDLLIRKMPFARLAREITSEFKADARYSSSGMLVTQEAAEASLAGRFENTNFCAIHGNRVTIMRKDMELARRIGAPREGGGGNREANS